IFIPLLAIFALQTLAILPSNFISIYGLQMGSVWESVLFALALAKRTKDLRLDRDRAIIASEDKGKLNERVTRVLEEERKAIAYEIHDNFNAVLILIKLNSHRIEGLASKSVRELDEHARQFPQPPEGNV